MIETKKEIHTKFINESIAKGGVACPFPWKLHEMLEAVAGESLENVVCWQPHGRAFVVKDPKQFVEKVLHRYVDMLAAS